MLAAKAMYGKGKLRKTMVLLRQAVDARPSSSLAEQARSFIDRVFLKGGWFVRSGSQANVCGWAWKHDDALPTSPSPPSTDITDNVLPPLEGVDAILYSPYPNTTKMEHSCSCTWQVDNMTDGDLARQLGVRAFDDFSRDVAVPATQRRCMSARILHGALNGGKLTVNSSADGRHHDVVHVRPLIWRQRKEVLAQFPPPLPWRRLNLCRRA